MLFDFNLFIEDLRENPEKVETIQKYEKLLWTIEWWVEDQIWFKEYCDKFKTIKYNVPEVVADWFNWDILMKLVASSLSSEWFLELDETTQVIEFVISVNSWDQSVVKKISELWSFQIARLYEIYIEEQMNLQILMLEDENEKKEIESQRESRINRWDLVLGSLEKNKLEKQEKKEKTNKLNDLMWKL